MENYISIKIKLAPESIEEWIAYLSDIGIESFWEQEDGLEAFVPTNQVDEKFKSELHKLTSSKNISYQVNTHDSADWNKVWESNFDDIVLRDKLQIRAPFHERRSECPEQLLISPKMAFGTGHHATTSMILEWMMDLHCTGKTVLDFGCGTGILGCYALIKAAKSVCFIDNEIEAVENVRETLMLNDLKSDSIYLGSAEQIPSGQQYDLILANITRNVLLEYGSILSDHLLSGASLIVSGFLMEDVEIMTAKFNTYGLRLVDKMQKLDWAALVFLKEKE